MKICSVDGCDKKSESKAGYCGKHNYKFKKYGDPLGGRVNRYSPGQSPKTCTVEGCESDHSHGGLCQAHYKRKKNLGSVDALYESEKPRFCAVDGCEEKHYCKSYCTKHYQAWFSHGDPLHTEKNSCIGWIMQHKDHDGEECLFWPHTRLTNGYGVVQTDDGRRRIASRVMCEVAHGMPIHEDMQAAHSCGNGNKGCMNPKHLRWATVIDNCHDKYDHGTHLYGEKAPWSKLTEHQVKQAKYELSHVSGPKIAAMLGVSPWTIYSIRQGRIWRHV